MKIYEDLKQGTPEWLEVKKLKFTASNAATIMAMGKGVKTLIKQMLAEYYSSQHYEEYTGVYKNDQMKRGNEFEDKARTIYELETGNTVKQVGFVEKDEYEGVSPDGLVGDDGLIEIKNHSDIVFTELALTRKIDSKYMAQMQMQMYVTGRKWCDYFGFNPNFDPCYVMIRVKPDPEAFEKLAEALPYAKQLLKAEKDKMDKIFNVLQEKD